MLDLPSQSSLIKNDDLDRHKGRKISCPFRERQIWATVTALQIIMTHCIDTAGVEEAALQMDETTLGSTQDGDKESPATLNCNLESSDCLKDIVFEYEDEVHPRQPDTLPAVTGEGEEERDSEDDTVVVRWQLLHKLQTILVIVAATVATFGLHNYLSVFNSIAASGLVGLVSGLVLPQYMALAAFCGSFAGMATLQVIPSVVAAISLGFFCALVVLVFDYKGFLLGIGGRLGFIALCACTMHFVLSIIVVAPSPEASLVDISSFPSIEEFFPIKLFRVLSTTIVGSIFMKLWRLTFARLEGSLAKCMAHSVVASSATGILVAWTLPLWATGPVYCGSFVPMAAPEELPTMMSIVSAATLAGLAQLALDGFFLGGWGGKLGTAALIGVLLYRIPVRLLAECVDSQEDGSESDAGNKPNVPGMTEV